MSFDPAGGKDSASIAYISHIEIGCDSVGVKEMLEAQLNVMYSVSGIPNCLLDGKVEICSSELNLERINKVIAQFQYNNRIKHSL